MTALKNLRHERFCQEYLKDLNSTAAYQRAYPKAVSKSARTAGPRLLANVGIAARVADLQQKRSERTEVSADMVITELSRIGFSDLRSFVKWGPGGISMIDSATLTEDQARCVAEVSETTGEKSSSQRFKLHDKVSALIKLGQHLGIKFVERHEHTGKDGADLPPSVVNVYVPDNGRDSQVNGNGRRAFASNGH